MNVKGFLLKNGTTVKYDYNELDNLPTIPQGEGLSDGAKRALLALLAKVAYIDANGEEYYDNLELALYPPANLVEITASFAQGVIVYDNQTLDSLKTSLTVTATYDNGTTATIDGSHYTLSGTLATGQSTITVSYGGETATFTVNVTHATRQYTITNTLTNCTNSNPATLINENAEYSGALAANSGYITSTVSVTMDGTNITSTAYNETNKTITIATVTGDIVITAVAIEDVGWISGQPYDIAWEDGKWVDLRTNGTISDNENYSISPLMPCSGVSAMVLSNIKADSGRYIAWYDEDETFLGYALYMAGYYAYNPCIAPGNAKYFRVNKTKSTTNASVTPYRYESIGEHTAWEAGKYYITDGTLFNCYGAKNISTSRRSRSFMMFFDSEKNQISMVTRGQNVDPTAVPDGARYARFTYNPAEAEAIKNDRAWVQLLES